MARPRRAFRCLLDRDGPLALRCTRRLVESQDDRWRGDRTRETKALPDSRPIIAVYPTAFQINAVSGL